MRQVVAEYPTDLVRLAALVRQRLGVQKGATVHLRLMLKTGLLTGQAIRFQTKAGRVQNHGLLVEGGGIRCFCRACGPAGRDVSASEFEEHSGSKDRRPADGIFLECEARCRGAAPACSMLAVCASAPCSPALPSTAHHAAAPPPPSSLQPHPQGPAEPDQQP
jgi:hypothetical protein